MKITIPGRVLKAARLFTSPDPARYILQNVCIERLPGGSTDGSLHKGGIIVATDGRCLIAVECLEMEWEGYESQEPLLIAPGRVPLPAGPVEIEVYGGRWSLNGRIVSGTINGPGYQFPKWRKICDIEGDEVVAEPTYNPRYMRSFMDAADILSGEKYSAIKVTHYKSGPIRILPNEPALGDWFGFLMRVESAGEHRIPFWGKPAPKAAATETVAQGA